VIAKGMATEWPTEEFKTLFETTRAGVVIPRALALDVCATLTELEITSADAILAMDPDMFEATVREHTEREVMVKISLRWFEGSRSQKKSVSLGLLASTSAATSRERRRSPRTTRAPATRRTETRQVRRWADASPPPGRSASPSSTRR